MLVLPAIALLRHANGGVAATGVVSVLIRPVLDDGTAVGVLVIGFDRRIRALPAGLDEVLTIVAVEAALAVERADLLSRLAHAAQTDGLTGAANRRGWERAVALESERGGGRPVVVALLDLDHFKAFNDTHGHQAGDVLLQTCVQLWRSELRQGDALARWGGEEFAVLLPDCTTAAAGVVLDRLRGVMPAGCTVSVGATTCLVGDDPARAVAQADSALYEAKRSGRDCVVWDRAGAGFPAAVPEPAGTAGETVPGPTAPVGPALGR